MSGVLGIIPARYGSTRFPGKPLADILGRPMIWHVYQRCLNAKYLDQLIVATDDKRIYDCVTEFGGLAVMTSKKHRSGTDRIAEALETFESDFAQPSLWFPPTSATGGLRRTGLRPPQGYSPQAGRQTSKASSFVATSAYVSTTADRSSDKLRNSKFEIIINIQGDEPLIDPKAIDLLAKAMAEDKNIEMATLSGSFNDKDDLLSTNTAKVVVDDRGYALYFSRAVIPGSREGALKLSNYLKHIGIYAYRRDALLQLISWPQSALEKAEKLEQLRALEHGIKIKLIKTGYRPQAVDTPADLARINKTLRRQSFA